MDFYKNTPLNVQTKYLFKNSSWVFSAKGIISALSFIEIIIITNSWGLKIYGLYITISAILSVIIQFCYLNFGTLLITIGAGYKSENRLDKLFALIKWTFFANLITVGVYLVVTAVLIFFSYRLSPELGSAKSYLFLFSIVSAFTFFNLMSSSILRLFSKFRLISMLDTVSFIIEISCILIASLLIKKSLENLLLAFCASNIIRAAIINLATIKKIAAVFLPYLKTKTGILKENYMYYKKFAVINSINESLRTLFDKSDILLLGFWAAPLQVGIYGVAKKIASVIYVVVSPLVVVLFPQLSELAAVNKLKEIKEFLISITKFVFIPSTLLFIMIIIFNREISGLFFKKEYINITGPLLFLGCASLLKAVFFWINPILVSLQKVNATFVIISTSLLVMAASSLFLFAKYQILGIAVSSFISMMLLVILSLFFIYHYISAERKLI